ncbi:MAG: hypothetical protein IPI49_33575 [Myxococcales bacterium]|nr:hypothetical protein [Myxococcales bacterium]
MVAVCVCRVAATTPWQAHAPMLVVVVAWSLRLTLHPVSAARPAAGSSVAIASLRARWAPHAGRAFFLFFQAQAALTAFLPRCRWCCRVRGPALALAVGAAALGRHGAPGAGASSQQAVADWQLGALSPRQRRPRAGLPTWASGFCRATPTSSSSG